MATAAQPLDLLDAKATVPSEMRSAEWARVDQWARERSFFMAGVAKAEIAEEMRSMVRRAASGEAGEYELRKEWEQFLDAEGYAPEPGQEGTIKDLRSLRRFNVTLRTNLQLMDGWARKETGLRPGPLKASPAWELVRVDAARVPRDWQARFEKVGGKLTGDGRMIAAKTSTIWRALGSRANFPDAIGVDYPPLAWGSGMDFRAPGAREVMALGVMTRAEIREQAAAMSDRPVHSPNASLQARPKVREEDLREALMDDLRGFALWEDEGEGSRSGALPRLIFTDPNGTRPGPVDAVASVIHAELPNDPSKGRPFPQLQRAALEEFAGDPESFVGVRERDRYDDLMRLLTRIGMDRDRRAAAMEDEGLERLTVSDDWRAALDLAEGVERTTRMLRTFLEFF
jgi:hypothetical protein